MRLELIIPGQPVAKARPRLTSSGHVYTPKKTADYEKMVATLATSCWKGPPMRGALRLRVTCLFKRPKTLLRKTDPPERLWLICRPDLDNCIKAVSDGLACVMQDDAQIVLIEASKLYCAKGEEPHVCVVLEPAV